MTPPDVPAMQLREVRMLQAPLELWEESARHTDELLREFALIAIGAEEGRADAPARLTDLVADLQSRYQGLSDEPTMQRQAAIAAGETSIDLTYTVPVPAGQALRELRQLLEESEEYCRRGELITLPSPPEQIAFRDWYLGEFLRQLDGDPPVPWPAARDTPTSVRWSP